MAVTVPLFWFLTLISLLSLAAGYALHAWLTGSASTRRAKPQHSPPVTQPSASALAEVQADQAALFSTLEKISTTVKRLSTRQGMRESRERAQADPGAAPPPGTPKAELYRHYGIAGKTPRQIAQHQLDLEASKDGGPN